MAELEHAADLSSTAVKLTVLCALRTGEVIGGHWEEIDLDEEIWTIPAARMKAGRQHRVPLSKAALHTLMCLKSESKSGLIFPGRSAGRPLSNMAMLQKIRGMDEKSLDNNGPAGAMKLEKSSPCMVFDQASETGPPRQLTSPTSSLKWPWRIKSIMRLKQRIDEAICWKNANSLWRNGLAMHCQFAKRPDKGKKLPELNYRMETRLASGFRAVEI
ncbi:tyrosine-type recombinase/integrase [Pseudomonas sp. CM25]|uniref:tyrosine-type recombinase/integrase n=1 Tax=Pseudomonas sp. CM25 TaxID=2738448 RepID=UPI002115463C|nr:tyrosine-type recombinase/integrase [Pseudomonas sp. CM25]